MRELYIGLMSGTSVDAIDGVLVDFSQSRPQLVTSYSEKIPTELRHAITELCQPSTNEIEKLASIDATLGELFAHTANTLLKQANMNAKNILAIGSHGQTIRHYPDKKFTLQIGDPNVIAAKTGITVIADFRRRDIAHGGQGAPLVPAFHQALFENQSNDRVILNIGGIANVTLLTDTVIGFDTGPGNTLLDTFAYQHLQKHYDENGTWAASGKLLPALLEKLLNDPYFHLSPPKSTGREYFNLNWLNQFISPHDAPQDIQATLVELTVRSIVDAIKKYIPRGEIYVCGGGTHNLFLMKQLKSYAKNFTVETTEKLGVHPNWMEAMAFAWLAKQTLHKKPGNICAVTGATRETILGGVYYTALLSS